MQVMKDLGFPGHESLAHVLSELECHSHRVAVVVVCDVVSPIDQRRPVLIRMGEMPVVNIDLTIAAVDFDNRSDESDDPVPDRLHVWTLIDRQAVRKLHQRCGRAGFGRVNRAGDVIDRR